MKKYKIIHLVTVLFCFFAGSYLSKFPWGMSSWFVFVVLLALISVNFILPWYEGKLTTPCWSEDSKVLNWFESKMENKNSYWQKPKLDVILPIFKAMTTRRLSRLRYAFCVVRQRYEQNDVHEAEHTKTWREDQYEKVTFLIREIEDEIRSRGCEL